MGIIDTIRSLLNADDEADDFVCIKCGKEYGQQFNECVECGNPYVVSTDEE